MHLTTQYLYGPIGPCVSCTSGALAQKGRPFVHGFEIYLERATLLFQSGAIPPTLLTGDGQVKKPKLKGGGDPIEAFTSELQTAVEGVVAGREPDLLSGQLARDDHRGADQQAIRLRTPPHSRCDPALDDSHPV